MEQYVVPYESKTERTKVPSEDTLSVWDLEKNAWRSFRLDSVIDFSFTIGE
jgi:hypothetical protein